MAVLEDIKDEPADETGSSFSTELEDMKQDVKDEPSDYTGIYAFDDVNQEVKEDAEAEEHVRQGWAPSEEAGRSCRRPCSRRGRRLAGTHR